jgi:uncharacterized protein YhaN
MTKKPTIAELLERLKALEAELKEAKAEIKRLEERPYIRNFSSNSYM